MASVPLDPRALLRREALVEPAQQLFNEDLVLADQKMTVEVDADTITYWVERHAQGEDEHRMPGPWDLGQDQFPEMTIDELERAAAPLKGLAAKIRFSANRLEFSTSQLDIAESVRRMFRAYGQKYEELSFEAHTNDRETANGGEHDSEYTAGSGGVATSGGHLVYTPDTGEEWDNGGDFLAQLREAMTVWTSQGRIEDLDGEVVLSGDYRAYTDSLTWGEIHEQLRVAGLDPEEGEIPQSIRVPTVYDIEIVRADFAIEEDGDMLLVDEGSNPVVAYWHEYERLNDVGFETLTDTEAGQFPIQQRTEDEDNGDAVVYTASGVVFVQRKPRYQLFMHGLLE